MALPAPKIDATEAMIAERTLPSVGWTAEARDKALSRLRRQ